LRWITGLALHLERIVESLVCPVRVRAHAFLLLFLSHSMHSSLSLLSRILHVSITGSSVRARLVPPVRPRLSVASMLLLLLLLCYTGGGVWVWRITSSHHTP